ncbi:Polypeptide N-acetylgalactosaminyltransferase 12 [Branchiostoma belcheri]|nr:Polypeptide N-acetylgalactosaminyltransferase 12 [Branchiostoma belcheri]
MDYPGLEPGGLVSPGIDWIHGDTFGIEHGTIILRITWGWSLGFGFDYEHAQRWVRLPADEQVKPVRSPMLLGGLFAIDRKFFNDIGMYDPGLEYWGGEHFEISFKVWMCGGAIETLPCSRVGHVWGSRKTYSTGNKTLQYWTDRNNMRVAEVWMDNYKVHFYRKHPHLMKRTFGDISERRRLRERLQCKDFRWYLDNAYPELYVPDDIPGRYGQVRNNRTNTCLDWASRQDGELKLFPCHHQLGNQCGLRIHHPYVRVRATRVPRTCRTEKSTCEYGLLTFFELNQQNQLRDEMSCVQAGENRNGVISVPCRRSDAAPPPLQQWVLTDRGFLYNAATNKCLHAIPPDSDTAGKVTTMRCNLSSHQKWTIEYIWNKE